MARRLPLLLRASTLAMLALGMSACSDSNECDTDDDCPTGRQCRLGLCALDPNADIDVGGDGDGSDTSDVPLSCVPAQPGDLVLTEILADPPSGSDLDGDGTASSTKDEFVEVVNVASHPVALSQAYIQVNDRQVALGERCLGPNEARVLFGSGGLPQLANSGATVSLLLNGETLQSHTYGSEGGKDSSMTLERQLDPSSAWVLHKDLPLKTAFSPGTCSNGLNFPECDVVVTDPDVIDGDTDSDVDDGSGPSDTDVTPPACSTAPIAGDLVINEIMADPGSVNDSNQDGTVNANDDEFIELVNVSEETLLLDGLVYKDAGSKVFNFPASLCLAPNQALLLFGKASAELQIGDALIVSAMGLSLNNGSDTVTFSNAAGDILAQHTYGSEADNDQSIVRAVDLDPTSEMVRHSQAAGADGATMSPGFCQSGETFPNCTQPEVPEPVVCSGVAPAVGDIVINEVMLQPPAGFDGNGDGNPNTDQDEFVELLNISGKLLNLQGAQVTDLQADVHVARITFGELCLAQNEAVLVFRRYAYHVTQTGFERISEGTSLMSLNNTGDTVQVLGADGVVLHSGQFRTLNGQSWNLAHDGVPTSDYVRHSEAHPNALVGSPGQCVNGEPLPDCLNGPSDGETP